VIPVTDWPESTFYPCEHETEHYVNVRDEWKCVICGDGLDEDTL
jgi:hypothetical protein